MTKKEELVKMLNEISKWESDKPIYSYPQALLDLVSNRFFPMSYIQLGQPEDIGIGWNKETGNKVFLGPNITMHFIKIGDYKINGDQNLSVLIDYITKELNNE